MRKSKPFSVFIMQALTTTQNKSNESHKIYVYDDKWQKPVTTELTSFLLLKTNSRYLKANYVAFPWATLFDRHLFFKDNSLLDIANQLQIDKTKETFTVIQHIGWREFLPVIRKIGITTVFTPHLMYKDLENIKDLNLVPMPLFPAQCSNVPTYRDLIPISMRKYKASFVGQYDAKHYMSDIRERLFDLYSNREDMCVIRRDQWHYQEVVYRNGTTTDSSKEREYKRILEDSVFSLCPSGTGPNSIRLWESMSYGCIPVLLADGLVLPSIPNLNWKDVFIIWKESDLPNLLDYLTSLDAASIQRMSLLNYKIFNTYFSKDKFINTILKHYKSPIL